jgi:thioesterase domain-containing protein
VLEIPVEGAFDAAQAGLAELVGMHLAGSRPPLLLVRTWTGELAHERALARHLGPDQPLYSVGPPLGARPEDFPADARAWGELAAARLERVPTAGPVFVGGWSFGGVIALEAAERMAKTGRSVAAVVMLDTPLPHPRRPRRRGRTRRSALHKAVRRLDDFLELRDWPARRAWLRERSARRREKLVARWQRLRGRRREPNAHELLMEPAARFGDRGFETVTGRRIPHLKRAIWVAYLKYQPSGTTLPVLLLRTDASQAESGDASLGWAPWLHGDFESLRVPGLHFTMFEEPQVAVLAARLAEALARRTLR